MSKTSRARHWGTSPSQLDIDPAFACPQCGGQTWKLSCARCRQKHYECPTCKAEFLVTKAGFFLNPKRGKLTYVKDTPPGMTATVARGVSEDGKPYSVRVNRPERKGAA